MNRCTACDATIHRNEVDSDYPRCPACGADITSHGRAGDTELELQPSSDTPLDPNRAPPEVPGYRDLRFIGAGGMGEVWAGVYTRLDQRRALKFLSPQFAKDGHFLSRFLSEARTLAKLRHENIVIVYDVEEHLDRPYISMELIEGKAGQPACELREAIHRGELSTRETRRLVLQVLAALAFAHERGVIHRDVKPGNVLIDGQGNAQLVDFGIAALGTQKERDLTQPNQAMGTSAYMAPEQRQDAKGIDARADLFSVGVMLYEMLTGRRPEGVFEPPSVLVESLPTEWDTVVARALRYDPSGRFSSASEMAAAIEAIAGDDVPLPRGLSRLEPSSAPSIPDGRCFSCDSAVRADAPYCPECGESLQVTCPQCQASSRGGGKFCGGCRYDLSRLRLAQKQRAEGLASLKAAEATTVLTEKLDHARNAVAQLHRAGKEPSIAPSIAAELKLAKRLYAESEATLGEVAYKAKRLAVAAVHFEAVQACIPGERNTLQRLQAIARVRDDLMTQINATMQSTSVVQLRALIDQARMNFSGDVAVESRITEAVALVQAAEELCRRCRNLAAKRQLYELQTVLRIATERAPLPDDLPRLKHEVDKQIIELAPAIEIAQQYYIDADFEAALVQANRILEFAVDCPAALSVSEDARNSLEREGARSSKPRSKVAKLFFVAVLATAVGAGWYMRDHWIPLLPDALRDWVDHATSRLPGSYGNVR